MGWHNEWAEVDIATLRRLWAEGMSAAQIGFLMHMTKNAVVGKVHRLDLAARPSPIRPRSGVPYVRPGRRPGPVLALPALPPVRELVPRPPPAVAITPPVYARPPAPVVYLRPPSRERCQWPEGDPHEAGFRFCGGAVAGVGRPYCLAHEGVAYVPNPRRPQ